jgi:hypothetical protein
VQEYQDTKAWKLMLGLVMLGLENMDFQINY